MVQKKNKNPSLHLDYFRNTVVREGVKKIQLPLSFEKYCKGMRLDIEAVRKRYYLKILEDLDPDLRRISLLHWEKFGKIPERLDLDSGIMVDFSSKSIEIPFSLFVRRMAHFIGIWLKTLGLYLLVLLQKRLDYTSPYRVFSDADFFKGIEVSENNPNLLKFLEKVEATDFPCIIKGENNCDSPLISSSFRPVISLLRHPNISRFAIYRLILTHILRLPSLLRIGFFAPSCLSLLRELFEVDQYIILDRNAAADRFYQTNSGLFNQHLGLVSRSRSNIKACMLFYSVNSFCLYPGPSGDYAEVPMFYFWQFDVGYYWCEDHYLWWNKLIGKHEGKIVGAIQGFPKKVENELQADKNEINISIFDVTPVDPDFYEKYGLSSRMNYYYTTKNCCMFIDDLLRVCSVKEAELNTKIRILFKSKRRFAKVHCAKYIEFLDSLAAEKNITIVDCHTDICDLFRISDLVVSVPFTSPSLMGYLSGVKSIYYDPVSYLNPIHFQNKSISLISNRKDLGEVISNVVLERSGRVLSASIEGSLYTADPISS